MCVTPVESIDRGVQIARRPDVIFCSFGDMLRVPGTSGDLFSVRAEGGDVRVVYSPLDAVAIAEHNPDKEVVFFAVGFETTAPANAMAVHQARKRGVTNFSVVVSHVLVPPAIEAIVTSADCRVDAFLAAGHVCTVMGTRQYEPIAAEYGVPIVVTGFEPLDVLDGIRRAVAQLEAGLSNVENAYERAVRPTGNEAAQRMLEEVFELTDEYSDFDAERRFGVPGLEVAESTVCRSGDVLQGLIKPNECPEFGVTCTPRHPLGATMVSGEGACAAYHRYRRLGDEVITGG